jgi:hypothetical protein
MEDVKNPLTALFEGISSELLTDEIQLKMSTLFEATVNEAVEAKEKELEEANAVEMSEFKTELVEQLDEYLDYFVTEYVKENEVVVEDFAKVKLAEKVLRNFGQMCEAFNISLSEESISSEDEVEELQSENNKLINQIIENKKEIEAVKKAAIISEASAGKTDLQVEKLIEAAKALDFESVEIFESKVETLLEKIIKEDVEVEAPEKLEESAELPTVDKSVPADMEQYMKFLKKKV